MPKYVKASLRCMCPSDLAEIIVPKSAAQNQPRVDLPLYRDEFGRAGIDAGQLSASARAEISWLNSRTAAMRGPWGA